MWEPCQPTASPGSAPYSRAAEIVAQVGCQQRLGLSCTPEAGGAAWKCVNALPALCESCAAPLVLSGSFYL